MDIESWAGQAADRREALGMSFAELAAVVGSSKSTVQRILGGKTDPPRTLAVAIENALGLRDGGDGPPTEVADELRDIAADLRRAAGRVNPSSHPTAVDMRGLAMRLEQALVARPSRR